jgi:DNA ligase (NAD+)
MEKSIFAALNEQRITASKKPFINRRNAGAGSVRQLDPKETAARRLKFFAYGAAPRAEAQSLPFEARRQSEVLARLKRLGFTTNAMATVIKGITGIQQWFDQVGAMRSALEL